MAVLTFPGNIHDYKLTETAEEQTDVFDGYVSSFDPFVGALLIVARFSMFEGASTGRTNTATQWSISSRIICAMLFKRS